MNQPTAASALSGCRAHLHMMCRHRSTEVHTGFLLQEHVDKNVIHIFRSSVTPAGKHILQEAHPDAAPLDAYHHHH